MPKIKGNLDLQMGVRSFSLLRNRCKSLSHLSRDLCMFRFMIVFTSYFAKAMGREHSNVVIIYMVQPMYMD